MTPTALTELVSKSNLIMIVGNYGSGKTEVAVNLAVYLQAAGLRVSIADLDIVNPYFRCREALETMAGHGIRVVLPPGSQQYADLPIVVPEIKGMLRPKEGDISLFDVGGDDVGARLLSSLRPALGDAPYSLLQVLNSKRPFTESVEGCVKMKGSIETASRMSVTGYISNAHLIEDTDVDVILEGAALAEEVSRVTQIPIEMVTAMEALADDPRVVALNARIIKLKRIMLPPWLRGEQKDDSRIVQETGSRDDGGTDPTDNHASESSLPAGRTKPIFRP